MALFESTAGWIDISPAALRKLRAELEQDEKGVLDEMGVGAIHTGYSDRFFPGTSVLHTRARYLLFVPWLYLWLADQRRSSPERVREMKEKAEQWLTGRLKDREKEDGIIGGRVYPDPPAQPIDFVYWTALREYRIHVGVSRADLLARWDRTRVVRRGDVRLRDDRVEPEPLAIFDVPRMPERWMKDDAVVSFRLTREEAIFLRDRLAERRPPCLLGMAASRLGKRARPTASALWEDAFMRDAAEVLDREHGGPGARPASAVAAIKRAAGASALAEVVRAIYAAHVEALHEQDLRQAGRLPLPDDHAHYRQALQGYWKEDSEIVRLARDLDLQGLRADIDLSGQLSGLLTHVQARIRTIRRAPEVAARLLDQATLDHFTHVEWKRKGTRARLPPRDGQARREGFGAGTVQRGGIEYRWSRVSRLLRDIQEGLFGE